MSNYIIVSYKPFISMLGGVMLSGDSRSTLNNSKHILNFVLSVQSHSFYRVFLTDDASEVIQTENNIFLGGSAVKPVSIY